MRVQSPFKGLRVPVQSDDTRGQLPGLRRTTAKGRSEGWILGSGNQAIRITDAGLKALGSYEPLPEGRELLAYWLGELDGGASRILQAIAEAYPDALSREDTAARAALSAASGTFATYLSKLRTLELISGKGELRASEELFDG